MRGLRQLCRLERDLPAVRAFIAGEKRGEILGLVGVDPDDNPGFTPGLFGRVADVAHYRLPGRDRESMQRAPLFPCRVQARRGALSTCAPPLRADRPRQRAFLGCARRAISLPDSTLDVTLCH